MTITAFSSGFFSKFSSMVFYRCFVASASFELPASYTLASHRKRIMSNKITMANPKSLSFTFTFDKCAVSHFRVTIKGRQ